jgi:uroporphyrinogen-III synthase
MAIAEPVTESLRIADSMALPDLTRIDWIAFTSSNAVTAFADILDESGRALPADVRLAAVGHATAQLVRQRLRSLDVVIGSSGGGALAEAILKSERRADDLAVLWPCAEAALTEFSEELTTAGANVIEWPVYVTQPIPPWALHNRMEHPTFFDVVVFAAPSAVKSLRDAWPEQWTFKAIAIGPTTAEALRNIAQVEPIVSASPRTSDLLSTILAALNYSPAHSALPPIPTISQNGGLL